jgi:membrane protein DedA with SNARE-associated domain
MLRAWQVSTGPSQPCRSFTHSNRARTQNANVNHLVDELHPVFARMVTETQPMLEHYGYLGLFLTNFGEGTGIPLPGQTLLVTAAVLATEGELHIALIVSLAFVSTLSGSFLGYLIGRTGGRGLLLRCKVPAERLERVEGFFARRGAIVVVLARFADGLRQTAPLVAGSLGMPWWRFFFASLAGAAAWVGLWGLGVYLLTEHSQQILVGLHHFSTAGWWITGLLGGSLLAWLYWRRRG